MGTVPPDERDPLATLAARLRCPECGDAFAPGRDRVACSGCGATAELLVQAPPAIRIGERAGVSAGFNAPREATRLRRAIRRRLDPLDERFRPHIGALAESRLPAIRSAVASAPGAPRILDVGGGGGHWRHLLGGIPDYTVLEAIDPPVPLYAPYVQADARALPFQDGSFDVVLSIELLEHLPEPGASLAEMLRVLGPEGMLVASTRQYWRTHGAPDDYFRYTRYGLDRLLRGAGFEQIELLPLGGTGAVLASTLENGLAWIRKPIFRQVLLYPLWLLAGLADRTVLRANLEDPQPETTGWLMLARRPSE
jgi:SAM-dependent methyltransferase